MKHLYIVFSLVMIILISSCSTSRYYQSDSGEYYQPQDQITYQQFYNDLSPYGNWIDYGNYGYAWVPSMANFRPYYTNGHWVYTDYGWTWVSNYNWGWAPFHYGRWLNDMRHGWVWIPGNEWAPAWVSWRGGGDYYGWAPLGPGMGMNSNFGSIPYNDWTFVPRNYINSNRINSYYVNRSRNVTIINNTTIINNRTVVNNGTRRANYNPGPPVREVEQHTGTRIRRYNLVTSNKPGETQVSSNSVRVFRPTVKQQNSSSSNVRPERVINSGQQRPSNNSAPVRESPKIQTPRVIRDEPPVNDNRPSITPEKNNPPARVSPQRNSTSPAENEPATPDRPTRQSSPVNDRQQENKPANQAPVRTFPNNSTPPAARERTNTPPSNDQAPVNKPVRRTSRQPSAAANPAKQNERKINMRPVTSQQALSDKREQASRPSVVTKPQKSEAVSRPARTFSPESATASPVNANERKAVTRSANTRKN